MKNTERRKDMEGRKLQIIYLYQRGMTVTELSDRLNIPRTSLPTYLKEWKIEPRFTLPILPSKARTVSIMVKRQPSLIARVFKILGGR
jgi:hypothetical protein